MTALACRAAHAAHHHDGHPGCRRGAPETLAAYRRIEADLSRRELMGGVAATLGLFAGFGLGPRELRAQTPPRPLHLVNLRLFDGKAAKITRFRDPLTALRSATGDAGDLLALSGGRAPYPGALGMIAPGAFADLLVVDGDPSASLDFLIDPGPGLRLIMKDGKVYKNALS